MDPHAGKSQTGVRVEAWESQMTSEKQDGELPVTLEAQDAVEEGKDEEGKDAVKDSVASKVKDEGKVQGKDAVKDSVASKSLLLDVAFLVGCMGYTEVVILPLVCRWFRDCDDLFRVSATFTLKGESWLHFASKHGRNELCRRLLFTRMCDVNIYNPCQLTPLHLAVISQHSSIVQLLLAEDKLDCNKRGGVVGETALCLAVRSHMLETVKLQLLLPSVDVNASDEFGRTPLFWACGNGVASITEQLLAHPDIDVNCLTTRNECALSWASSSGHLDCVSLLTKRSDIKINQHTGEHGFTPLMIAANNGYLSIVELLLSNPQTDVERTTTSESFVGWTAITLSSSNEIANLLQQHAH